MCDGDRTTVRRRRVLRTVATAEVVGGTGGCLYLRPEDSSAAPLEVLHGWTGGEHAVAMQSLIDAFERTHPETPLDERSVSDADAAELAARRIENDDPPGTFVTWLGAALERDGVYLRDVGESVWDADMREAHLTTAREACRSGGKFAGVSVGDHRVNELFYDPSVLATADVDPVDLTSVEALLNACERIEAQTDAVPFAHAALGPWTTTQLLETVLVAESGPRSHGRWREGRDVSAALARAVGTTRSLLEWNHPGSSEWSMLSSASQLADDEAAFLQQGS